MEAVKFACNWQEVDGAEQEAKDSCCELVNQTTYQGIPVAATWEQTPRQRSIWHSLKEGLPTLGKPELCSALKLYEASCQTATGDAKYPRGSPRRAKLAACAYFALLSKGTCILNPQMLANAFAVSQSLLLKAIQSFHMDAMSLNLCPPVHVPTIVRECAEAAGVVLKKVEDKEIEQSCQGYSASFPAIIGVTVGLFSSTTGDEVLKKISDAVGLHSATIKRLAASVHVKAV